ncbi:MAG: GW dipeptide domain-containing protein [Ignavibacteria bacterium]|jgi:hypothetical protein
MNYKSFLVLIAILFLTVNCSKKEEEKTAQENNDPHAGVHKVVVAEVVQANQYTYLKVNEKDEEYWIAVTKRNVEEGEKFFFTRALEMKDFESKDLQRTFDRVLFVDNLNNNPMAGMMGASPGSSVEGKKPVLTKQDVSIDAVEGGITIAELYNNKEKYGNKKVKIKGKVTKVNKQIMGRNWVHIQDGTGDENTFDLTVTTDENVGNGDVVTFEGVIALNKDFGAGYSYKIIMEQAKKL